MKKEMIGVLLVTAVAFSFPGYASANQTALNSEIKPVVNLVELRENATYKFSSIDFSMNMTKTDWGSGHNGFMYITPTQSISNWVLEFDYEGIITKSGNVNIRRDGNHYTITPKHWNSRMKSNARFGFDYLGKTSNKSTQISNVILYNDTDFKLKAVEAWKLGGKYAVGDSVTYEGFIYRCITAHTVHAQNWHPINTPALWKKSIEYKSKNVVINK